MPQMTNESGDVREVADELVPFMEARRYHLTGEAAEDVAEDLKGKALDQALEDAGLPKSGTADEKRARYAEYLAGQHDGQQDGQNDLDDPDNKEQ